MIFIMYWDDANPDEIKDLIQVCAEITEVICFQNPTKEEIIRAHKTHKDRLANTMPVYTEQFIQQTGVMEYLSELALSGVNPLQIALVKIPNSRPFLQSYTAIEKQSSQVYKIQKAIQGMAPGSPPNDESLRRTIFK